LQIGFLSFTIIAKHADRQLKNNFGDLIWYKIPVGPKKRRHYKLRHGWLSLDRCHDWKAKTLMDEKLQQNRNYQTDLDTKIILVRPEIYYFN